jgi:DeoR/GlpR family transcriptional regulator of sugar metabolism
VNAVAEERRSFIVEALKHNRAVRISELTRRFDISEVSIRRDLHRLEEMGLLRRVHGGAVAVSRTQVETLSPADIDSDVSPEKQRIGRVAAALVKPGERLIFDSGTTALQVARSIPVDLLQNGKLTVITGSLPIVRELGAWKSIHFIFLGGVYLPEFQVVAGPQTISNLSVLHADKFFLGADGITLTNGVTTANVLEAEVDQAMARAAGEVILVSGSAKIGVIGLASIMPLEQVHKMITDTGAPAEFVAALQARGVEVACV